MTITVDKAHDVHEGDWDGSSGRFTVAEWHRSCLVHLHGPGTPDTKDQCKLPVRDPDGHVNRHGVHAAAARLNQVDAPPDKIARARSALRAAYRELDEQAPAVVDKAVRNRPGGRGGSSGPRRVRTASGSKKFGQPIGSIITADMLERAARAARGGQGGGGTHTPPQRGAGGGQGAAGGARGGGAGGGRGGGAARPSSSLPKDPARRLAVYRRAIQEAQDEDTLRAVYNRIDRDSVLSDDQVDELADDLGSRIRAINRTKTPAPAPAAPVARPARQRRPPAPQPAERGQPAAANPPAAARPPRRAAAAARPGETTVVSEHERKIQAARNIVELNRALRAAAADPRVGQDKQEGLRQAALARRNQLVPKTPTPPPRPRTPTPPPARNPLQAPDALRGANNVRDWYEGKIKQITDGDELRALGRAIATDSRLDDVALRRLSGAGTRRLRQLRNRPRQGDLVAIDNVGPGGTVRPRGQERPAWVERVTGLARGMVQVREPGAQRPIFLESWRLDAMRNRSLVAAAKDAYKNRIAAARNGIDLERIEREINQTHIRSQDKNSLRRALADRRAVMARPRTQARVRPAQTPAAVPNAAERRQAIRDFEQQIDALNDPNAESVIGEIAQQIMVHPNLRRADKSRLGHVIEDKIQDLEDVRAGNAISPTARVRMFQPKVLPTGGRGRRQVQPPPGWAGDPNASPAARAIGQGKTIDELEPGEGIGLLEYARANPGRFDVKVIGPGISESWEIKDKDLDKKYFMKSTTNDGLADMFGDGINEYLGAKFGVVAFGGDAFLDVDFVHPPEGGKNPIVRMDHLDEWGKRIGAVGRVNHNAMNRNPFSDKLKDPKQALSIHIYDYLINQQDRHPGNYGWAKVRGGAVLVPLDNGGAFHAYNAQAEGAPIERIKYDQWISRHRAKTRYMVQEAKVAYEDRGWGQDKVRDDAAAIIEKFKQVDADKILADMKQRFPNMDDYERQHAEAAVVVWKKRLTQINADEVAERILR